MNTIFSQDQKMFFLRLDLEVSLLFVDHFSIIGAYIIIMTKDRGKCLTTQGLRVSQVTTFASIGNGFHCSNAVLLPHEWFLSIVQCPPMLLFIKRWQACIALLKVEPSLRWVRRGGVRGINLLLLGIGKIAEKAKRKKRKSPSKQRRIGD